MFPGDEVERGDYVAYRTVPTSLALHDLQQAVAPPHEGCPQTSSLMG